MGGNPSVRIYFYVMVNFYFSNIVNFCVMLLEEKIGERRKEKREESFTPWNHHITYDTHDKAPSCIRYRHDVRDRDIGEILCTINIVHVIRL